MHAMGTTTGNVAGQDRPSLLVATDGSEASLHAGARDVGADYVILGAEATTRLGHAIFGSVSEEVLRRADRTVLLVGGKRTQPDPLLGRLECLTTEA